MKNQQFSVVSVCAGQFSQESQVRTSSLHSLIEVCVRLDVCVVCVREKGACGGGVEGGFRSNSPV